MLDSFAPPDLGKSALERIAPHCDVVDRLEALPSDSMVRGIWFKSIGDELARRGLRDAYAREFPRVESFLKFYPLPEYLVRLAFAGSLVTSPAALGEGMLEISRGNAVYFAKSLLGRGLIRLLARDPVRLAEQAVQSKRHATNFGTWSLGAKGARSVEIVIRDEYTWIESAMLGAAAGTFESSVKGSRCEVKLRDRFNGSIFVHW